MKQSNTFLEEDHTIHVHVYIRAAVKHNLWQRGVNYKLKRQLLLLYSDE